MDIQGALKELIRPAEERPRPWQPAAIAKGQAGPKKIRRKHLMIMTMHMAGFSDSEIARELGYTPVRVGVILRSKHPQLQIHKAQVEDQVAQQMGDLIMSFRAQSRRSLETLVEIRDKADAPLSEKRLSALAILDRAGYSPVKKQVNIDANIPFQELKQVVGQIDQANEVLIRRDQWTIKDMPKE